MKQFKNSIVDLRVSRESRSNSICKADSNFQSVLESSPQVFPQRIESTKKNRE